MELAPPRDLKTGQSLWQKGRTPPVGFDRFASTMRPDVVVVGTGISGALMADALQDAGLSVVAVDRRQPITGSSPASTALLMSELDTPMSKLSRKVGLKAAAQVWLRSAGAAQALANRIADLGINCDFRERSSLYLPGDVLDLDGLKREADLRRQLGLRAQFIGRAELLRISGLRKGGAIVSRGNGEADPVKLVAGLWRKFRNGGGLIVRDFDVSDVDESASRVRIVATDGRHLLAKHAVLCTGYEFPAYKRPDGFTIISTWAIATRLQTRKLWPGRELIWEASDPYLYMRTTADGRIVAGGGDEEFSDAEKRDSLIAQKTDLIAKLAGRLFPNVDFEPEFRWTGSFGASDTGMPAIGLVPRRKRTYAVLGFGGNGFTFSMLAAQIVSRTINGMNDPDLALFRL